MPLLYHIEKPLANVFMRVFYKLESSGAKNVPDGRPVVIAPNHVNAFVDPTITAMMLKPTVRFFARGDVFKGKLARIILNSLNISPMYRIQEGYSELKKNDKTFEECRSLLSQNKGLLMFPEGICIQGRRARPLKKGLSRIVFQTEEMFDFKKDILIFPVGLNYSNAKKFRSEIFLHFGEAISINDYEQLYRQDKVKAINELTKKLESELAKLLIHIRNPENDRLVEGIEEMFMIEWLQPSGGDHKSVRDRYYASKEIAAMVNKLEDEDKEQLGLLRTRVVNYIRRLRGNDLRDHLLRPETINKMNIGTFLSEYLVIFFGFPVYLLGLIGNYPPYFFAKQYTVKNIKTDEFHASVYSTLAMLAYLVYYALQVIVVGLAFRSWLLLAIYAFLVPVLGYFCLWFYPKMMKIFGRWRLLRMVRKDKQIVQELVAERASIVHELETLHRNFVQPKKQSA
jgi:1-acyl-sn-glycerol-3-phosphate acyltransferase